MSRRRSSFTPGQQASRSKKSWPNRAVAPCWVGAEGRRSGGRGNHHGFGSRWRDDWSHRQRHLRLYRRLAVQKSDRPDREKENDHEGIESVIADKHTQGRPAGVVGASRHRPPLPALLDGFHRAAPRGATSARLAHKLSGNSRITDIYGFLLAGFVAMGTLGDRIGRRRPLLSARQPSGRLGARCVLDQLRDADGCPRAARYRRSDPGAFDPLLIRNMFLDP